MFDTGTATEFAEGTIDFGDSTWFCTDHATRNAPGKQCAFCAQESMTPAEFDAWLASHSTP